VHGYCDVYVWGDPCLYSATRFKDLIGINVWEEAETLAGGYSDYGETGVHWVPGYEVQDFDGVVDDPTRGPYVYGEESPGTLFFTMRLVIGETTCHLADAPVDDDNDGVGELWTNFKVHLVGETRCTAGGEGDTGNPCDAATGNKHEREVDYAGAGLELVRNYNSVLPIDFGFGPGWATPFHKRLERFADTLRLRRGDGSGDTFTDTGSGWAGPPDSRYRLADDPAGYRVTLADGAFELYDTAGKLLSETDRAGQTINYAYDTNGQLLTVTGPFGHTLTFAYDTASGNIASVTTPDGKLYQYEYDSEQRL
jgi:YD repeat-containing protein